MAQPQPQPQQPQSQRPQARQPQSGLSPWLVAALLLLAGLALRLSNFGDPNLQVDDAFYMLVGERMHAGAIPYVDIWDRKPLGLFAIYYLITAISASPIAYQVAAWLSASTTAWVIARIAGRWTNAQGAVLAGLIYLALINAFGGDGGQSPVFYNLFVASGALLVLRGIDRPGQGAPGWRSWAAMALLGLAISVKQTAFFEAVFLGLIALAALRRAGAAPRALLLSAAGFALVGAAPMLLIAGWYAAASHWHEFWQAMVLANFRKGSFPLDMMEAKLASVGIRLTVIAAAAAWSLFREAGRDAAAGATPARGFLIGWLAAALIGFVSVPNFAVHYALPLMVPASVAAGLLFGRGSRGRIAFAATLLFYLLWHDPADFARTRDSAHTLDRLAALVRDHDGGGGLLVYDGPPYLYVLAGKPPITPLAFPHHLGQLVERNVSHLNTATEIDRIVAGRPGVIVSTRYPRNLPVNADSYRKIRAYAQHHCRRVGVVPMREETVTSDVVVMGDCH